MKHFITFFPGVDSDKWKNNFSHHAVCNCGSRSSSNCYEDVVEWAKNHLHLKKKEAQKIEKQKKEDCKAFI